MASGKRKTHRPFTQPEIDRIAELYATGLSTEAVGEAVGRPPKSVWLVVKRLGLNRPVGAHLRKYHPREDAFDCPERDEAAAYWLGFLLADGGIIDGDRTHEPTISLELKAADKGHVEAFAAFMGLPREAVHDGYKGRQSAFLKFRSAAVAASLARYGVVPRKSLTADPPERLKDDRHFLRGLIDGDGCLSFSRVRKKYETGRRAVLSFCGSEKVIANFARYACLISPGCRAKPKRVVNLWAWVTNGSHAVAIVRTLYADCTASLPRKLALAREFMAMGDSGYQAVTREDTPQGRLPRGRRFLTHNGVARSLAEWSRASGIPSLTISVRLDRGWSVEDALTVPVAPGHGDPLRCTRPGCSRPHAAQGLCSMHYKRQRRGRAD